MSSIIISILTILDEYRNKLHSWLSSPDPSSNHNAALKKKQSNTGQWFIQSKEYASWKRDFNSFIWLHGIRMSSVLMDLL